MDDRTILGISLVFFVVFVMYYSHEFRGELLFLDSDGKLHRTRLVKYALILSMGFASVLHILASQYEARNALLGAAVGLVLLYMHAAKRQDPTVGTERALLEGCAWASVWLTAALVVNRVKA